MLVPFLSAVGVMLVLEGVMPFLSPQGFRRMLAGVARADDWVLRVAGLISMLAGALLVFVMRG